MPPVPISFSRARWQDLDFYSYCTNNFERDEQPQQKHPKQNDVVGSCDISSCSCGDSKRQNNSTSSQGREGTAEIQVGPSAKVKSLEAGGSIIIAATANEEEDVEILKKLMVAATQDVDAENDPIHLFRKIAGDEEDVPQALVEATETLKAESDVLELKEEDFGTVPDGNDGRRLAAGKCTEWSGLVWLEILLRNIYRRP